MIIPKMRKQNKRMVKKINRPMAKKMDSLMKQIKVADKAADKALYCNSLNSSRLR